MRSNIAILFVLVVFTAFVSAQTPDASLLGKPYQIVPGDKIEGKVLGEEDFNFNVVVDQTGKFRLPFVEKEVVAKCRTEENILEQVKQHYSRFLRNPMVSVRVTERRKPDPVTVAGEVVKPGQVELARQARLMELITFSGGFKEEAGGMVQLYRTRIPTCADNTTREEWNSQTNNGTELPSYLFSRSSIASGGFESNPIVYPGDIILVEKASPVYINGMVRQAGGVYIKEGGLTLTQAIAMVGGLQEKAKTKDVKIFRVTGKGPKQRDIISINLDDIKTGASEDVLLEPYDIIEVDRAKDSLGTTILKFLGRTTTTAGQAFATGGVRVLY